MDSTVSKIIIRCAWIAIIVFAVRYLLGSIDALEFLRCETLYDYFGAASDAVSISAILFVVYDRWLWKFNPLDSTPRLMGNYTGTIKYNYNGQNQRKGTGVAITQTSLKVKVKITTNEITSSTITSDLIEENGEYVLYYTYITNPHSKYSNENPMQHGTCRLVQISKDKLEGKYWTSRKTIGDISLTRVPKKYLLHK